MLDVVQAFHVVYLEGQNLRIDQKEGWISEYEGKRNYKWRLRENETVCRAHRKKLVEPDQETNKRNLHNARRVDIEDWGSIDKEWKYFIYQNSSVGLPQLVDLHFESYK